MPVTSLTRIDEEAFENGRRRIPVCLCLDVSGSMLEVVAGTGRDTGKTEVVDGRTWRIVEGGESRMSRLIDSLGEFKDMLMEDRVSSESVDLCIVTFSDSATVFKEFTPIAGFDMPTHLTTGNSTNLGAGLKMALDELNARKELYKNTGMTYFQPIMVVMSDGAANGDESVLRSAIEEIHKLEEAKKLSVFPIVLDDKVAKATLDRISAKRPALALKSDDFKEFFIWLNASIQNVGASVPGAVVTLPKPDFAAAWESL